MTKIHINILASFLSLPEFLGIIILTQILFFTDDGNCIEYRFEGLAWILDFFFDGYHYDANLFYFALIFVLSFGIAKSIIKHLIKLRIIR
jgi:hypothetical protein